MIILLKRNPLPDISLLIIQLLGSALHDSIATSILECCFLVVCPDPCILNLFVKKHSEYWACSIEDFMVKHFRSNVQLTDSNLRQCGGRRRPCRHLCEQMFATTAYSAPYRPNVGIKLQGYTDIQVDFRDFRFVTFQDFSM